MDTRPVLILKVGETVPGLRARRGDFDDWFRAGLGLEPEAVCVVHPHRNEALPEPGAFRGLVVTGSSAMVTERSPWSEAAKAWLAAAVAGEVPLLGVCYGHQLLAEATGGRADWNVNGREIGSVEVELTAMGRRDALFAGLPERLVVQATHSQSVVGLPPAARLLGRNDHDAFQAFAVGRCAWGVQFHPEFDADVVRGYLQERRTELADEGIDVDQRMAEARDSAHGRAILCSFRQLLDR